MRIAVQYQSKEMQSTYWPVAWPSLILKRYSQGKSSTQEQYIRAVQLEQCMCYGVTAAVSEQAGRARQQGGRQQWRRAAGMQKGGHVC